MKTAISLADFHGALSAETADAVTSAISNRADRHMAEREDRRDRLVEAFDDPR